jgi:hypothetical protein
LEKWQAASNCWGKSSDSPVVVVKREVVIFGTIMFVSGVEGMCRRNEEGRREDWLGIKQWWTNEGLKRTPS